MDRLTFSPDQLRAQAEKFQAKQRKFYLMVIIAFSFAVASYVFCFFLFHNTLLRVGSTLSAVAFGYLVVDFMVKRARAMPDPAETDGIRYYRTELERNRDYHRGVPWRFLLLPVPLVMVDIGLAQFCANISPVIPPILWSWAVFLVILLAVWAPMKHRKAARKYQELLDALERALGSR